MQPAGAGAGGRRRKPLPPPGERDLRAAILRRRPGGAANGCPTRGAGALSQNGYGCLLYTSPSPRD
eukprot:8343451-Alexandrium_andersonii.AAC.1